MFHEFLQPCNNEQWTAVGSYLVEEETARQSSDVENPGTRIANPPVALLLRVAVHGPLRMRQQLYQLLRLRIAEGVTHRERLHRMQSVGRGAIEMISAVRKVSRVRARDSRPVHRRVIWWTVLQTLRSASQQHIFIAVQRNTYSHSSHIKPYLPHK